MSKSSIDSQNAINIVAVKEINTPARGVFEGEKSDAQQNGQQSVQLRAQLQLREMILAGELPAGARIAELSIVEKLGFSRTPIRAALVKLEQEGLLDALPNGGYAVKTFSERDVAEAIELRGTLEGLSARLAAERGAAPVVLNEARQCLQAIDAVLSESTLDDEAFASYVKLNEQFHALLSELSGSSVIAKELELALCLAVWFCGGSSQQPQSARHAGGGARPALAGAGRDRQARGLARRKLDARAFPHRSTQPARGGA
jgi:DNA-binding GntR family transcriptional regulator